MFYRQLTADARKLGQVTGQLFIRIGEVSSNELIKAGHNSLVDIILPTYRPDISLLRRAIRSVVDQTHTSWRLILVQDGNDCELRPLVFEFNDPRIDYFELPHEGKPAALNYALGRSQAKYIAYLDDDDIWYPNHLSESVAIMESNGIEYLYTDAWEVFVSREDDFIKELSRRNLHKGLITDKTLWSISHINVVHQRAILDKAGLYDVDRPYFIDWDMFQRMAGVARPYHLKIYTAEHYIYLNVENQQTNAISSAHGKDPDLSRRMHFDMFRRSLALLTQDELAEIAKELALKSEMGQDQERLLREKEAHLTETLQLLTSRNNQLADYDRKLSECEKQLYECERRLYECTQQLQESRHYVDMLKNSFSWRLTGPLRKIAELITNKK